MSSIKTTQIDGDVSIGRNVAIGGTTIIQGDVHIKGGMKVDGWLEAKNIKAANKGLFTTVEKLREAYPLPHDGWWAIVGNTIPGSVYVVDAGKWIPTGETGGSTTTESGLYASSITDLKASMATAKADISGHTEKIKTIEKQSSEQGVIVNQVSADSTRAKELATSLQTQLNTIVGGNASEAIDNFNEVIKFLAGVKDNDTLTALLAKVNERLTTLENDNSSTEAIQRFKQLIEHLQTQLNTIVGGNANEAIEKFNKVKNLLEALKDSRDLNERLETLERAKPSTDVLEVLEFDGFTSGAVTPILESAPDSAKILFDAINKRFVAKDNDAEHYSTGWIFRKDEEHAFSGGEVYQTEGSNPRPFTKKIYVNRANNTLYRWNGEELIKVGENDVKTLNTAITELKNKKIVAEEVTTTENGDTKELTLQAGKVYALFENVNKLRIKAIAPPENAKEVAEVMLYFHTGQNSDSGVVTRSGDAPTISFESVILPKDVAIEKNMFYEVSFKYNPIARKYTVLVVSWAIA